ncbi:ABC transporter substrate-binding protein [Pandoraea nosoerga]|uniref:ABC transporter substrate-binding protein n=1 Tax=Pandoraea nosoerga TaxID=2508296 RepID=A0A5E4U3K9_9BURK|nr:MULTISPECIES: ABC transporter substrate-binding protein [Pandoraea]MBN4668112.1 ABC transporter substrate-binding protein [Pandoraea nosoerga]MBN4677941.1 ABC transporter substrate-binding protein [Pandoraea nosoerga]MBN4683139.1 ABC transporter substrate-binding protein [Pandoraea nosoerga]MBN4747091.1 ABC transporter substrate-binding protein [Pandoraea nosoerga]VVD94153.1 ABC transporter substrate-binding protein [Pandoraea nosoerga]
MTGTKTTQRKAIAALGALAAAAALFASGGAHADVKIGFIGTLSGPGGALGQDQYDAFMLAIEQKGGKLGGVPVQVIKEDDQLKPDVGVQAAQKLVERDKVSIITGVTFSNVMMAIHKNVTNAGVIMVGSNAGPTPIAGAQCSPNFFSTSWDNDELHEAGGQLSTDLGYKKMYVMAPNYQAGRDAVNGFKRDYKGQIVDEVYTQVNQPDYSAEIAQLQAARPDAVYVFYPGGMGVNFVKQYRQAGLLGKIPLISVSTIDGSTLPALKELAVGAITSAPYSPDLDNAQNKQFVAAFQKKYNRVPSMYAAQSYDAANLIDSALTKTRGNAADREALRAALKAADFQSVRGPFKFASNQFPIAQFYRVDVVKDATGAAFAAKGKIDIKTRADLAAQCKMKS